MTISFFSRIVSLVTLVAGPTKNEESGTTRLCPGPETRTLAPSAMSAGAVSDGWTMTQAPPPKMAWFWFSPPTAKQWSPPFRAQWKSPRKYQQRGRWQRLPPIVPWFRSCGLATAAQACASARYDWLIDLSAAIWLWVVIAPIRTPPAGGGTAEIPGQLLEPADADQRLGREHAVTQAAEQVGPPGMQPGRPGPPACSPRQRPSSRERRRIPEA